MLTRNMSLQSSKSASEDRGAVGASEAARHSARGHTRTLMALCLLSRHALALAGSLVTRHGHCGDSVVPRRCFCRPAQEKPGRRRVALATDAVTLASATPAVQPRVRVRPAWPRRAAAFCACAAGPRPKEPGDIHQVLIHGAVRNTLPRKTGPPALLSPVARAAHRLRLCSVQSGNPSQVCLSRRMHNPCRVSDGPGRAGVGRYLQRDRW